MAYLDGLGQTFYSHFLDLWRVKTLFWVVFGEIGAQSARMPEGGVLKSKDRALGTYLKCHHTGLGVKGVPCHIVLAYPVDVVHTVQHKRVFPSLNKE